MNIREEQMSGAFTKFHLDGPWPFDAVLHRFTEADLGDPHDHPYSFQTFILSGGYVEEIFTPNGASHTIECRPGTSHFVRAECIHRIIDLPTGECWSLILPGPPERETRFWDFSSGTPRSRAWHEAWA